MVKKVNITVEAYRFNYITGYNEPPEMTVHLVYFTDVDDIHHRRLKKAKHVGYPKKMPTKGGTMSIPMPEKGQYYIFYGELADGTQSNWANPIIYGNDGQKVTLYFEPVEKSEIQENNDV